MLADIQRDGDHDDGLVARSELAKGLHDAGHCGEAAREIDRAWQAWRAGDRATIEQGCNLAFVYTVVLLGCARFTDVDRYEAEAAQLLPLWSALADGDAHIVTRAAGHVLAWHLPPGTTSDDTCQTPSSAPRPGSHDDPRTAIADRHDRIPRPRTVPPGSPAVVQHSEPSR